MIRTLPVRVEPMPGEALESWLAALSTRMNACWGEVLDTVLPLGDNGIGRVYRGAVLTSAVSEAERDYMSAATGIPAADVDGMTLAGHYGGPLVTVDDRTGRARTPWGVVYRQRFCPLCMKASRGRRKLEWFMPWITTCIEHRCFLADRCPQCGQVQSASDWFRRCLHTHEDRCQRFIEAQPRRTRCMARLATSRIDKLRPGHPVLTMQETLTELLAGDIVDAGLYRLAPAPPAQLLIDVQVLGNWILRAPNIIDLITTFGGRASRREISLWERRLQRQANPGVTDTTGKRKRAPLWVGLARPAPWVGAGVAAALTVLLQPSLEDAAGIVRGATRWAAAKEFRYRPHVARQAQSPVVTALHIKARAGAFSVLDGLRYRTVTDLPRLPDTARHDATHALLHSVPTLFWPEWALRLDAGKLPWSPGRQVMSRLLVTIGCTMAIRELERRLRSTVRAQWFTKAANDLHGEPYWDAIVTALLRLHEYLQANPAPIDYQRRRGMNYDNLLPEAQWTEMVAEQGLHTTPRTAIAARLWLTEQLSCAPLIKKARVLPKCGEATDRMRRTLTPQLVDNIDDVAAQFLRTHGVVEEPLTWAPPLTLLDGLALPGAPPDTIDASVIHDLVMSGYTVPAIARQQDTSVWRVRYQLEHHPIGPSERRGPARLRGRRPVSIEASRRSSPKTHRSTRAKSNG